MFVAASAAAGAWVGASAFDIVAGRRRGAVAAAVALVCLVVAAWRRSAAAPVALLACAAVVRRLRVTGVTGGIGSGKSTLVGALRDCGAVVVDADRVYADLLSAPGSRVAAAVCARFPDCVTAAGAVDRAALRARVMHDAAARRDLNAITHPAIALALLAAVAHHRWLCARVVVLDVPLLFESGVAMRALCRPIVVVSTTRDEQVRRVCARDGVAAADARAAVDAQLPLAQKEAWADVVVHNGPGRSVDDLRRDAAALFLVLRWL